ncbi:ABC transporter ATP-binding protein [Oceaniglobus ichthyenteri]|uniref:ABC transporter ATP-binding protein n=1 Tax=Oceaniglobus ichthyenteri TaxID=2136177 RepID=UPI000D34929A|nr:ABC transporter ATP-binding protein [Oceaniglobus ichthyenteri]
MTDDVVHIDRVTKKFGKITALDEMNIKIKRGEFVTFLGPSGCGKSTTLRILGGFERPDSGTVYLSGQDVTRLPPNRRKVNMVFQDYALFPHMTVRQNVAFGLELKGMGRSAIDARITEILSFLELMPLIDRFPDQISGGQRQRAALARALAPDPDLLLLDEPLGALDARLRAQVQIELKSIQRSTGKTFFFVTHDQDEALTMSDRIVVMNGGKIEQDGTPEDLYLRPKTRFVAEFIGETNMLEGQLGTVSNGTGAMEWQGQTLTGIAQKGTPGQPVHASIRLERVQISPEKPSHDNVVSGRLVNSLFKGNRRMFEVKTPGATLLATAPENDSTAYLPGSEVWLGWNRDDMIILAD